MLSVVISTLLWLWGITSITICCLIHEWMEVWRNDVSLHTASCDKIRDDVTNSLVPDFRNVSHSHWVLIMSSDVTECIVPSLLCRSFRWSVQTISESWKRNYVNEILRVWGTKRTYYSVGYMSKRAETLIWKCFTCQAVEGNKYLLPFLIHTKEIVKVSRKTNDRPFT